MLYDRLAQDLYSEICRIPLIDPRSRVNPLQPTACNLADILASPDCTDLARFAGIEHDAVDPRAANDERVRTIFYHLSRFDNTVQYHWILEIARAFLNYQGNRLTLADCGFLSQAAERAMKLPDWEERVLHLANIDKIFITRRFNDPLEGFDTTRYIPCLQLDELVFQLHDPGTRRLVEAITGIAPGDAAAVRRAAAALVQHFTNHGARVCCVAVPPDFAPGPIPQADLTAALAELSRQDSQDAWEGTAAGRARRIVAKGVFWILVEQCAECKLTLHLLIGRGPDPAGGWDFPDVRPSLRNFGPLFATFYDMPTCVTVLSGSPNQELVGACAAFANLMTCGHWWVGNAPGYIQADLRARLQGVAKTKQLGCFSDMHLLEFALPKFNMYRRVLAQTLADDFIRPRLYSEAQAVELARLVLRDNARRVLTL
jgi:glucuronate isomerase